MKDESNPYAPPGVDPTRSSPEPDHRGQGWRMDGLKVLIRDGAVLPDVCILGGPPGGQLRRIQLRMVPWRSWRLSTEEILLTAMQSDEMAATIRKRRRRQTGVALLTGLLAMAGLLVLFPDLTRSLIPLAAVCFFPLVGAFQASKDPRVVPVGSGWYELQHLSPAVISELSRFGRAPEP